MAGEITVTGTIVGGTHDTGAEYFQAQHYSGYTTEPLGKLAKSGYQTNGFFRFDLSGLPPKAKVTNAFLRIVAAGNSSGGSYTVRLYFLEGDGKWSKPSRNGWMRISSHDLRAIVRDTGGTPRINTAMGASDQAWALRQLPGNSEKIGQKVTNLAGFDFTLGEIRMDLTKVGSPTGNIGLELYQAVSTVPLGNASFMAPGAPPLAVSDSLDVSTLSASKALVHFPFSGGSQITISNTTGQNQYFVAVTGTFAVNGSDYVTVHGNSNSTGTRYNYGTAATSGTGYQFDVQNYPDDASLPHLAAATSVLTWVVPNMTTGNTYESTDISSIVQQAINLAQYQEDGRIAGLTWNTNSAPYGFQARPAMFESGYNSAELVLTFRPRRVYVVM